MRSSHLIIMAFCHVIFTSIVFYFAISMANATPLAECGPRCARFSQVMQHEAAKATPVVQHHVKHQTLINATPAPALAVPPAVPVSSPADQASPAVVPINAAPTAKLPEARSSSALKPLEQAEQGATKHLVKQESDKLESKKMVEQKKPTEQAASGLVEKQAKKVVDQQEPTPVAVIAPVVKPLQAAPVEQSVQAPKKVELEAKSDAEKPQVVAMPPPPPAAVASSVVKPVVQAAAASEPIVPQSAALVAAIAPVVAREQHVVESRSHQPVAPKADGASIAPSGSLSSVTKLETPAVVQQIHQAQQQPVASVIESEVLKVGEIKQVNPVSLSGKIAASSEARISKPAPMVNGGLGPLHLLATTLCSYQPDRQVADDAINQLYARRAIVRKSLLDFMSLKFTNLEKLSSRLGVGLQVVPIKSIPDSTSSSLKPTHGWPVVGKCSAHDLKLMGEAAWCECQEGDLECNNKPAAANVASQSQADVSNQVVSGKQNQKQQQQQQQVESQVKNQKSARSIETIDSFSPEQASIISKILLIGDAKDTPVAESNFYNLNLTQHQLETLEAQATSTQECRRNALRYSKALFQHLAEDQQSKSDSWPKLYAQISGDDCARKRMIDIMNALSSFRTETTSIRRDNVEFAFAMDDLRTKVLENEVNVPLTFDRHFIQVEQFLQQSVRLMLSSVQPKRAKITSMRYRSLMYGAANSVDEQQQCIDLHQRLLAKNYPSDCDPTQFGQLPDVLRMTANSLELWSIEKELSMNLARVADYPNVTPVGQQKFREDVNECIANLVAS